MVTREQLAFYRNPQDFVGHFIEVWFDGAVALHSSDFSKRRKATELPVAFMEIKPETTVDEIDHWLDIHDANG